MIKHISIGFTVIYCTVYSTKYPCRETIFFKQQTQSIGKYPIANQENNVKKRLKKKELEC